jgi:hypothetical protein
MLQTTKNKKSETHLKLWTAFLLTAQFALLGLTFFILSRAINWPASLRDAADIALPRLIANSSSVLLGYSCYLLAALLLIPATALLNSRLNVNPAMAQLTLGFAIVSAICKTIGISRWLFVMPLIAKKFVEPDSDQKQLATLYSALNSYAGGIGEFIGVGLATGVWSVLIGIGIIRFSGRASVVIGGFSIISGIGLFLIIPTFLGLNLGPVLTISNMAWQFSLIATAAWVLISCTNPDLLEK